MTPYGRIIVIYNAKKGTETNPYQKNKINVFIL